MKNSNLIFSSNVYVVNGAGMLSDPNFMTQVIDPGAIGALIERQRRIGLTAKLSALQKEIYDNALPCAYSGGDCTHGSIKENGEVVCVNKCENTSCINFSECSTTTNFREIERDPEATFDFVGNKADNVQFEFDIDLPVPKTNINISVKKLTTHIHGVQIRQPEIEEILKNNSTNEWGVRGHYRHLPDGTDTWVRPHTRKHHELTTTAHIARFKAIRIVKKHEISIDAFKKSIKTDRQNRIERLFGDSHAYQLKNISLIDSADIIVKSSLQSRILVNAGPGTGKTHTVIERLKYIANKYDDVDPDSVLVLCFSRSAVKVIRDRLNKAMEMHEIPYIAKRFNVLTFDSFATWYLKQIKPNIDLTSHNYDDRIRLFISEYEKVPDNLCAEYLIIDEVQDLVGPRAKMVRSLLKNIDCGFLLLGDECQAIYDYQIGDNDELNASKLYEWLENYFEDELTKYELTKEWRHKRGLEEAFKPLRHAMLYAPYESQENQLNKLFNKFDIPEMGTEDIVYCYDNSLGKRAILSWANGDAYRQSQELFARDDITVKHTILTGSRKLLLRKELALIFSNITTGMVVKKTFFTNGKEVGVDDETLNSIWFAILCTLNMDPDEEEFSLYALRKALISEKQVDEILTTQDESDLVISTIHKAKGKEYDAVIVNKFGRISNSDDIKVYYVAMTRAKNELIVKSQNRHFSRDVKTADGRFIELNKQNAIKRIELGVDGDVDPIGFIDKNLSDFSPQKRQEYIANKVKIGDPLQVSKYKEQYLIIHEGHVIGRVNKSAFKPYKHSFPSGKYFTYNFDKYTDFVDIFVKDIVTIVNQKLDSAIPEPYSKSGFWLGVEFCGYAKPMEE